MLRALGINGGADALEAVRAATKDADQDVQTTAIQVFLPSATAAVMPASPPPMTVIGDLQIADRRLQIWSTLISDLTSSI